MLRRYYGKISFLPINEFVGHDGELVVDDITGKVYVMDGVTYGGTELVGATPRFGTTPPSNPTPGTLWYDPVSGRTYIYFQDTWVDAAPNTTFILPEASTSRLGGIKVGRNLTIDVDGTLNAEDGNYTLPTASHTQLGGVKVDNVSILINGSGTISANNYSISQLISNAAVQENEIARLNANVAAANVAILAVDSAWKSNASTQATAISTLFSNASTQASSINALIINAATQANSINSLQGQSYTNANVAAYLPRYGGNILAGNIASTNDTLTLSANAAHPELAWTITTDINDYGSSSILQSPISDDRQNGGIVLAGTEGLGEITWIGNVPGSPITNSLILATTGNVAIGTSGINTLWKFDLDGNLQIPENGAINYSNGNSILSGIIAGGSTNTEPSSTPPASPSEGQLWYDTVSGRIYVYLSDSWVDSSPPLVSNQYNNSNVAAYLPTDGTIISLRANATTQAGYINSIFANLAAQTGNSSSQQTTINYLLANSLSQESKINSLRANVTAANAAIVTANSAMKSYVDSVTSSFDGSWVANAATQATAIADIYSNLSIQSSNSAAQQNTINYLLANTVAQENKITSLKANIDAANAAIITANVGMKIYVDGITTAWNANAATQATAIADIYSNLSIQSSNSATQQNTINYLLANTVSQENEITALRSNITAANSTISTKTVYSNSNVAAYLPTYSGSIGGSITVGGLLQAPQYTKASNATGTVGQICWDANYIYVCTATNTWKRAGLTGGY